MPTAFNSMIGSATAVKADDGTWMAWTACGPTSVCALRVETGEVVQRLDIGAPVTSVPTVWHGSLYVAADLAGGLLRFDPARR